MKTQFVDENANSSKLITFTCVCGIEASADVRRGPSKFRLDCPNLQCRRIFEVEYVGRVPEENAKPPELPPPPPAPLRLVR